MVWFIGGMRKVEVNKKLGVRMCSQIFIKDLKIYPIVGKCQQRRFYIFWGSIKKRVDTFIKF